jgi:hypothetical protein
METLPVVSFILWATGLSSLALIACMTLDWHAERRAHRAGFVVRAPAQLAPSQAVATRPAVHPQRPSLKKAA